MSFATNLRYVMDSSCINSTELAADSQISPATIYRLINGQSQPRPATVRTLALALHCKPSDLTGDSLPTHIRKWAPNKEHCEEQLTAHLQGNIGPQSDKADNMAVVQRMMSQQPQSQAADSIATPALPLSDLQALFDACVEDNAPAAIFSEFGKQVYLLMTEHKKED